VNARKGEVLQIARECCLDGLQFHGNESPEYCSSFSAYKVIKSFALKTRSDLKSITHYNIHAILIDAYDPANYGGTGKKADWELARQAKKFGPLILAGGLTETNVQEAIKIVSPYGVDVSSSMEKRPGVKDMVKMRRFVEMVRVRDSSYQWMSKKNHMMKGTCHDTTTAG
jgi:phosphoribosylanthranilate isomerase